MPGISLPEQRIKESIYLIMSTALGERILLPDFGCARVSRDPGITLLELFKRIAEKLLYRMYPFAELNRIEFLRLQASVLS